MSRERLLLGQCVRLLISKREQCADGAIPSMDNLVDFTRYQRNRAVHIADGRLYWIRLYPLFPPTRTHILGTKNQLLLRFRSVFKDPKTCYFVLVKPLPSLYPRKHIFARKKFLN